MAQPPPRCPTPHPLRASRYDSHADSQVWSETLEVIGSYADSSWIRCRNCGAWFWLVSDSSRFAYENDWRLPTAEAERALLGQAPEPAAVVALLVGQGLPHGPMWELGSARVDLLRHLTPGHADRERIAALQAMATLDREWTDALAILVDQLAATQRSVHPPTLEFVVDLANGDLSSCGGDIYEFPGFVAVPLPEPARFLFFTGQGAGEIPVAGPPQLLARQADTAVFLLASTSTSPSPSLLMLRPETMLGVPLPAGLQPLMLALDRGHYLLISEPKSGAACRVELRNPKLEFVASLPMFIEERSTYPTPPRAMAEGWVFSNTVDQAGQTSAICLFGESWQVVAQSQGIAGGRRLDPIDETRLLAVPRTGPGRLEGWRRVEARFERTFDLQCHTHVRIGERVVGFEGGHAIGLDLAGTQSWRRRLGPLMVQMIVLGPSCVLLCGERLLALIDPDTGASLDQIAGPIDDLVLVDRSGWAHQMFGTTLLRSSPAGKIERTPLDGEYRIVSTAGAGVVVRHQHEPTRHLWIAGTGELLGEFEADARWSVIGSLAGPHVLERDRLRLHRIPASIGS